MLVDGVVDAAAPAVGGAGPGAHDRAGYAEADLAEVELAARILGGAPIVGETRRVDVLPEATPLVVGHHERALAVAGRAAEGLHDVGQEGLPEADVGVRVVVGGHPVGADEPRIDDGDLRERAGRRVRVVLGDGPRVGEVAGAPERDLREVGVVVASRHAERVAERPERRPVPAQRPLGVLLGLLRGEVVVLQAAGLRRVQVVPVRLGGAEQRAEPAVVGLVVAQQAGPDGDVARRRRSPARARRCRSRGAASRRSHHRCARLDRRSTRARDRRSPVRGSCCDPADPTARWPLAARRVPHGDR